MQIHLIATRHAEPRGRGFLSIAGGWDEGCLDGNREGFEKDFDKTVDECGYRNVREVITDIDADAALAAFG